MKSKVILNYKHIPGGSCIASALSNVANYYGHKYSQDFIITSGFNFGFISDHKRNIWNVEFLSSKMLYPIFLENTGISGDEIQFTDNEIALSTLLKSISSQKPVIVKIDPLSATCVFRNIPIEIVSLLPSHCVVVYGYDLNKNKVYMHDNSCFNPIEISIDLLCKARNSGNTRPINTCYNLNIPSHTFSEEESFRMSIMGIVQRFKHTQRYLNFRTGHTALERFIGHFDSWKYISEEETLTRCLSFRMSITNGLAMKGAFRRNVVRFLKEASYILRYDFDETILHYNKLADTWNKIDTLLNDIIIKKNTDVVLNTKSSFFTHLNDAIKYEKEGIDLLEYKISKV